MKRWALKENIGNKGMIFHVSSLSGVANLRLGLTIRNRRHCWKSELLSRAESGSSICEDTNQVS